MPYDNVLAADARPRFFLVRHPERFGFDGPPPRRGVASRTYARSLDGMQKEVLVVPATAGWGWRLSSDEGPSLEGYEEAPVPLAFFTAGLVASYTEVLVGLAKRRGVVLDGLCLTLDNYYERQGSALRGTMVGRALDPTLHVELETPPSAEQMRDLCADMVEISPMTGLLRGHNLSVFTLTHNGRPIEVGQRRKLQPAARPHDDGGFAAIPVDGPPEARSLVERVGRVASESGAGAGEDGGAGLRAERPRHTLDIKGICTLRDDGAKVIDVYNAHRDSTVFRFLSDELAAGCDGQRRAPDAATLVSAGIAFCFMTQLARYIRITRKRVDRCSVIQDLRLPSKPDTWASGQCDAAAAVEARVDVQAPESEEYVRTLLQMAEQTCYLHAACRSDLRTTVTWSSIAGSP